MTRVIEIYGSIPLSSHPSLSSQQTKKIMTGSLILAFYDFISSFSLAGVHSSSPRCFLRRVGGRTQATSSPLF